MQYAVSDIHGCYDKYVQLLRRINLKDSDTLYVPGDMIDRSPEGLKVLLDISMRPNVVPFLGNHEYAALTCLPWLMEELTEENTEPDKLLWRLKSIQGWMADGGDKTVEEFRRLSPEARQDVLDLLEDLTVYEETEAGGREYVLVHAGLCGFSPGKALDDYRLDELILSRPEHGQSYFRDKYLVFGHTPTPYYTGKRPEDARIYRKDKGAGGRGRTLDKQLSETTILGLFHKVYACGMLAGIVLSTTKVSEFLSAMNRIHAPKKLVIPLAVMLRYIPTIQEDWRYIKDAMKLRDVSPSLKGLITNLGMTVDCIYVPLMMAASKAADELSTASVTRGIENPKPRTCLVQIRFGVADGIISYITIISGVSGSRLLFERGERISD